MASSTAWRVVSVIGSILGGAAGIAATHAQVNESNKKREQADEIYRQQLLERTDQILDHKLQERGMES